MGVQILAAEASEIIQTAALAIRQSHDRTKLNPGIISLPHDGGRAQAMRFNLL